MNALFDVIYLAYAVIFILSIALMILAGRLLLALTTLARTLSDYWHMRARAQYAARDEK